MSVRTKVLGLVDVIMRVPPLFVIDEILKIGMGLPNSFSIMDIENATISGTNNDSDSNLLYNSSEIQHILSITTLKFLICVLGKLTIYFYYYY